MSWSDKTPIQCLYEDNKDNRIYIKRDDLLPFSFGGNKARKAVNFFQVIDVGDYDCVVTYGSSSSNHCRIISNMAAARGLPCYIIGPQEASKPTFNSKMMELFGANLTIVPVDAVHDTIENKLQDLRNQEMNPYFISGGGHGNLGTQAYVDCYEEILDYENKEHLHFDYIFFASGTGTTQAGLVCGQLINQDNRKVVGISIARKNPRGRQIVLDSIREYLLEKEISIDVSQIDEKTIFIDNYIGSGYGTENIEIENTIREMLFQHGIPMDTTYTGKAYTGMKKFIEKEQICGKNILFIHTGGIPLFFDDLESRL